ncbi:hypothetical protein V494_05491 [Pseudogymnoascus sp. VKM F-4513 (FW-928)]|nr:hypothetical protein V494_05491 [Pseudogymnoascus sp. VKM F-4513 (FW-928)]
MADAEAKAKAEKLAAARKRVEQLKQKKGKKEGASSKKQEAAASAEESKDKAEATPAETPDVEATKATEDDKSASPEEDTSKAIDDAGSPPPASGHRARQPSLSVQSKMRSSSFRQGSGPGPLSPPILSPEGGDTAPEIHRRQQAKIEELERENKRLAKETSESERRWKKAEEDLEELREADTESKTEGATTPSSDEAQKLKSQVASLERQNAHLQAQVSRPNRHGSSPSVSHTSPPSDLAAELASKSTTIETMELEISNLRAQLARTATGSTAEKEQIAALEDKVSRTQKSLDTAQHELGDLKKNLERTTERAVREGSSRTSAETKLRTLEREAEDAKTKATDLEKKVEALEKKITTLTTLHKEHDARSQTLKREREKADKEAADLRTKLAAAEAANRGDDDGVDDIETEVRQRLERRIRELESEVAELKRGLWREGRKELEAGSPGAQFSDIDLSGGERTRGSGGIGEMLNYGINALTGAAQPGAHGGHDDGLLDDDGDDFDEEAWRKAQEEEGKRRIERIREVKRGLDKWKGWRVDLVEVRRVGGERMGEVFEPIHGRNGYQESSVAASLEITSLMYGKNDYQAGLVAPSSRRSISYMEGTITKQTQLHLPQKFQSDIWKERLPGTASVALQVLDMEGTIA